MLPAPTIVLKFVKSRNDRFAKDDPRGFRFLVVFEAGKALLMSPVEVNAMVLSSHYGADVEKNENELFVDSYNAANRETLIRILRAKGLYIIDADERLD